MTFDVTALDAHALTRRDVAGPADPVGIVLVLHGGRPSSVQPVDRRSASWRRMAALQRAIAPTLGEAGVGSWLLRYQRRGWNRGAPVADVRWALQQVRAEHGPVPVVLLGHSMGARAAVHAADDASVVGVVGLAPWWQPDDPVAALAGRRVAAAHGGTDRITSARMTRAYLQRAGRVARSTEFHDMGPVGHYLLRHVRAWNDFASSRCLAFLG